MSDVANQLDSQLERLSRYYDLRHGSFQGDLDLYRELARDQSLVVELGCGTGRLLAPLGDEATRVVGIDRSPAMLRRARARVTASGMGPRVHLVAADLRAPVCSGASLAVAALNTLCHFTERDTQLQVLRSARESLIHGGQLVLDVPNPHLEVDARPAGVPVLEATFDTPDGLLMEWTVAEVSRAAQVVTLRSIYDLSTTRGLTRETCTFELYLYYRPELEFLLERAGFRVESVWGDYDGSEYRDDSPRMVCLAQAV